MKQFEIVGYDAQLDYHVCRDAKGDTFKIDLRVDGSEDFEGIYPEEIIGRTVEMDYIIPYNYIGMHVKLKPQDPNAEAE